jgi:6-phosphogluconate dehydrogenase
MEKQQYDFGMIGLGTMGRNLMYNMCDHGFSVTGLDKDNKKLEEFHKEKGDYNILLTADKKQFINILKRPRVIMLLVPAGNTVDEVIDELIPLLSKDDLIMDCGNSHFNDTDRRMERLAKENIHFMGTGVSGGESGARFGPSIMPGGSFSDWERVAEMLIAVSAKVNNEPCVTYLGPGSAGHYVKMVHNGIEYALMQLISETYHLLKVLAGMNNAELHKVFSKWNQGILQSYLISITADIFTHTDDLSAGLLVDMILDSAHQKGTGMWMSQNAMDLHVPIPAIDTAVAARDLSAFKKDRVSASKILRGPSEPSTQNKNDFAQTIEKALYFSMITTYSQGMSLLQHASKEYNYGLKLNEVAKIWRGGCIIRASLLENIHLAYVQQPDLPNLMIADVMANDLVKHHCEARKIIKIAVESGIPVPCFMASLAYYDSYRHGWLPSNLIQAQRDYFGAHTYERTDRAGVFHTQWIPNK